MIEVCDLISANEIKNMKVERISIKVCSCWILKSRIGDDFEANVTGIEEWGIYVSIADPIAEGLVRFRDIAGDDYYVFNPDQGLAYGKRSGRTFRRGDKVMVRLLRVDPLRGQADFSIIEKLSSEPKKRRRTRDDIEQDARNFNERADRAAAAEALGYVSQPEEDFDDGYNDEPEYLPMKRGRDRKRTSDFGEHSRGRDFGGRGGRGDSEGYHVASKPREARRGRKSSGPKAFGEKLARGRGGRGKSGRR